MSSTILYFAIFSPFDCQESYLMMYIIILSQVSMQLKLVKWNYAIFWSLIGVNLRNFAK